MIKKTVLALAMLLSFSTSVTASSFRCGDNVIAVGDHVSDVLTKCPSPTHEDESVRTETIKEADGKWVRQEIKRRTLTYDLGSGELIREVVVENGKVVEINSRGYGRDK